MAKLPESLLPATREEYIKLIDDALIEVDELAIAIEYDGDEMAPSVVYVEPLRVQLQTLKEEVVDGTHEYEDKDLDFMELVNASNPGLLPFGTLLKAINETHRRPPVTTQ